jgi:hypothetical protein
MPVTHGVAGSSPVQTAILEEAFLNGKAFLFLRFNRKERYDLRKVRKVLIKLCELCVFTLRSPMFVELIYKL